MIKKKKKFFLKLLFKFLFFKNILFYKEYFISNEYLF